MRFSWLFFILSTNVCIGTVFTQNDSTTRTNIRSDYKTTILQLSETLAAKFNDLVVKELGSDYTSHFEIRSAYKVSHQDSDTELLNNIADKLSYKISSAKIILRDMYNVLSDNSTPSFTHPCPFNSIRKSVFIRSSNIYESLPLQDPKLKMLDRFKDIKVKRQYFLSHIDYATDRDCTAMPHSNLRYLYHKVVHPEPKLVVFIIDNNMSSDSLQHAVNVAKETVYALQSADLFALKMTNMTDFMKFEDSCSIEGISDLGNATDNNKLLFREHLAAIDISSLSLSPTLISNELKNLLSQRTLPKNKLLIFLTDTKVLKNETWLKMFPYSMKKDDSVHFAIGLIYENQIDRNSSLGILHIDKWHTHSNNHSVMRLHINDSAVIGQVASAFISLLPGKFDDRGIKIEGPIWEATERDFMVSLVQPTLTGVLGLDLYWSDLAEDIIYFKGDHKKKAFVMDFGGKVLMHTYFPRPETAIDKIKFTNLENIDTYKYINDIKTGMYSKSFGNLSVSSDDSNSSSPLIYSWKWVDNLYIVCIVSEQSAQNSLNKTNVYFARSNKEILFHRLDLFPPKSGKICRHFKQIATIDQGTVYLSPSSFQSPFTYLYDMGDGQEAVTYMQNYLAYLKSVAHGLLSNPGLKNEIQQDVGYLNTLLSFYKRQHLHGPYSKYVVRRYAVTESGVLVMFPGTVLEYDYEPVRRPWYTYAIENPGKIILTPPNLDVGGAGYVVSLSYAVKSSLYPTMVVSMDMTMGFLYKLLIDNMPVCAGSSMKCFIMNNRGYLISHPGLMDPNSSGPIEQQHITHKESMIAIDMLNHKSFVSKRLCNNFYDKTIQRFYEFNISLSDVLSNVVSGDHCVHYYIAAIPGTNAFVGLVNASCPNAFCPCSINDRLCLNCNRMEQTECECPCECSSEIYECANSNVSRFNQDIPLCGMMLENNNHKSHYFYNFAENLKTCFDFQCETYTSHSSCLGVLGCEWCQIDTDGSSTLLAPFCTSQSTCFNGVLGAVTPYGEGTYGHMNRDALGGYSAIGPIAGCIVTVSLIVAVAIYCYRQNVTSASCHNLYVDGPAETWHDPDVQMSQLHSDDVHDQSGHDKLLPAMEMEAPISPYRVVTGYRRAHTAGGSDHGYSTMTPHEDSEATGFSVNDPIILSDDTKSDISCPLPAKIKPRLKSGDLNVTVLPCGKNSIIAPVTVHRHMEAS